MYVKFMSDLLLYQNIKIGSSGLGHLQLPYDSREPFQHVDPNNIIFGIRN